MNYVDSRFALDLCNECASAYIPVRKGENMRRLCVSLKCGAEPYKIETDVTAKIYGKYPSGTAFNANATISDNVVKYVLSATDLANVGEIQCEVRLTGTNSELVISPTFRIKVFDVSGGT